MLTLISINATGLNQLATTPWRPHFRARTGPPRLAQSLQRRPNVGGDTALCAVRLRPSGSGWD